MKPPRGKNGHVSDAHVLKLVDQGVVSPMDDVIEVLHANDLGDAARLSDLSGRDVAQAEMADQALSLELGERGERLLDRFLARPVAASHEPQVDDVENVDAEVPDSCRGRRWQGPRARSPGSRGVRATHRPDFGHDHEVVRIGVKRLSDQLVGDVRAIEIAGVNVIDSAPHGRPQHGERGLTVLRRPKYPRAGDCIAP